MYELKLIQMIKIDNSKNGEAQRPQGGYREGWNGGFSDQALVGIGGWLRISQKMAAEMATKKFKLQNRAWHLRH